MKKNTLITVGVLGGLYLLLTSFKKPKLTGTVYVEQSNAPTGTYQVFSKVNTQIWDRNGNPVYTYDTANLGMTVTGTKDNTYYAVVIGSDFANGTAGFVLMNDVNTI
jgi:hypothetical protein